MEPLMLQLRMPTYGPEYPRCWVEDKKIHVFTASEYAHRILPCVHLSRLNELVARLVTEDVTEEILGHINKHLLGQDNPITKSDLGLEGQLTREYFVYQ